MSTKINTELDSAPKKIKVKKVLPAVVLVTTFYYSSIFTLGLMLGYLATKFYCHKMGIDEESGDKIFFDVGKKWTIHLHHWIMGVIVIAFVSLAGLSQEIPIFLWGALFGMMAQDIYDYNDWHEVIIKKEEVKI
jgi:hypothetical protein